MLNKTNVSYKVKNKTDQTLPIIGKGYLLRYEEIVVEEITEQIRNLEKIGLVSIRTL